MSFILRNKGADKLNYVKTIGNPKYKYGHNKVYSDNENYYIKAPKKDIYLIIDKDNDVLNYLEKCITKYGNMHSTNGTHGFELCKEHNGQRKRVYVSQLLIAYYQKKRYKQSQRLLYKDSNPLNCKRNNLFLWYDNLKLESKSVTITFDDDYIYIKEKRTGLVFVTDYEYELLRLLANPRVSFSLTNNKGYKGGKDYNRLNASIFFGNKRSKSVYTSLSQLVYGYYYYGVRRSNIITAIQKMQKDLQANHLVIEHLIADELNNTKANLSAMNNITNSKKRVIDRKIQPPYYLIMAYKDGIYKAVYCFGFGTVFVMPVLTYTNAESLLNGIKKLVSSPLFNDFKSALEWHTASDIRRYNLPDNYRAQKVLYDNFDNPYVDMRVAEYIKAFYGE